MSLTSTIAYTEISNSMLVFLIEQIDQKYYFFSIFPLVELAFQFFIIEVFSKEGLKQFTMATQLPEVST